MFLVNHQEMAGHGSCGFGQGTPWGFQAWKIGDVDRRNWENVHSCMDFWGKINNVNELLVGGFNHLENMKVNGKDYPKSAHTALAVKACLLGGNSYTKCSITFVNIAVAISALAGGAKNGFAPRPEFGGVFDIFRGFLGVWAQEGVETEFWVVLVAFRQWKNGQKPKKHCT